MTPSAQIRAGMVEAALKASNRLVNIPEDVWTELQYAQMAAAIHASTLYLEAAKMVLVPRVVLNELWVALCADFGDPDDYPDDDGAVGSSIDTEMAITFALMRRFHAAMIASKPVPPNE